MSTVKLSKVSHKDPSKFRISHDEGQLDLDEETFSNHKKTIKRSEKVVESYSDIAIIGAGFGGIGVALNCLKKLKTDNFVIFEKHSNFGGTWWANTYPGCASDIPAVFYSYYDEVVSNWSDIRPPQYEVEEYVQKIVDKYGLRSHARFKVAVEGATWDDDASVWVIDAVDMKTGTVYRHRSKLVANCTGGLVVPNKYNPPGLSDVFQGDYMHSGIWDWSVDFKGKKVIVVGNGCSAAQVVPELLKFEPHSITQVVRSQHHIFPPHPQFVHFLYHLLSWSRFGILCVRYLISSFAEMKYPMYTGTSWTSRLCRWLHTRASLNYMKTTIPEKYHEILIPDFKIGCKRLIYDYYYAPSLQDPRINVLLNEIEKVKERSVILKDGSELEADIIVACTGYNVNHSMKPYNIVGRNGTDISKLWNEEAPNAYETILIKDCPNFFAIAGPNSFTGHSSVILAIENASAYFTAVAKKVLDGTYTSVGVKTEKYYEWRDMTQELLKTSVFGTKFGGCVSWYTGHRYNSTAYPFSQIEYYKRMRNVKWKDLEVEKKKDL